MLETGTGGFPAQLPSMPGAPAFSDEFDLDIRLGVAGKKPHDICEGTGDDTTCDAACNGGDETDDCGNGGETEPCVTVGCVTEFCGTKENKNTCITCETRCEQKTCALTCETCNTECKQQTCATCATHCKQLTCATCETHCEQKTCLGTCLECTDVTCIPAKCR